jgi:CRP-like cAMP-binding protein
MHPRRQSMRLQSRTTFSREAPSAICNLPPDIIDEFESLQAISEYREGSMLYQQGQKCAGVFRLCSGRAKLKITGRHGKAAIVKIAGTNELLGLCEALMGRKYLLTAEIIEFSSAAFIRREQLLQLMSRNVAVANRITQQLAYEYFELFDESRCLRLGSSASQRLANLIVHWAGKSASGPRSIEISNTHSEIAQMIGCSRETVTRLLHDFQQQRLISFDDAAMKIDDMKTLRQLALS